MARVSTTTIFIRTIMLAAFLCISAAETSTSCKNASEFCGGIAGFQCCEGLECILEGDFADAGGQCKPASTPLCSKSGEFCGGLAGFQCCQGLDCKLDGDYPDAGGLCTKPKRRSMPQEYHVYLNDLPGNDFNTIFRSLARFEAHLKQQYGDDFGHCFVNGVPGSFYGRLFPTNHLHFVHSSYSLMWLSQVPDKIEDNKRNIYIASSSPSNVVEAYYEQFEKDFQMFLRCRSHEVVAGGIMVLTVLGRKTTERYSKESCYEWELLATALNDMVLEGLIEEEKLHTFNIPQYTPSAAELSFIIEKEGSFTLNQVHVSEVSWETNEKYYKNDTHNLAFDYYDFVKCMRSVAEPLLVNHFGKAIIEELFERYTKIVQVSMATEKNVFVNVTVSVTRSG